VLIWVASGASRPVSSWFNLSSEVAVSAEAYDAGNPVERNFYLLLILAGFFILLKRHVSVRDFLRQNLALSLFTLFWGVSVIWADYPLITFKRWIKDSGTIIMVLILLSEINPLAAFRMVFVRCAYILIPFSLLLIRYFSDLGRLYSKWDGGLMNVGVTPQKNSLGMLALASVLFVTWDLIEVIRSRRQRKLTLVCIFDVAILIASIYILYLSHSATSIVCTILGLAVFIALRLPSLRHNIRRLGFSVIIGLIALFGLNTFIDLKSEFLILVGRDPTLTSRTEVWPIVLQYQTSPILGPGFKSFWAGTRLTAIWENYHIIQAHDGYLETYLNGGVAGVGLLLAFLVSTIRRIGADLQHETIYSSMRLTIWLVVVIHNYTEASFNTFSPLWIALLVVSAKFPAFPHIDPTEPSLGLPALPTGSR